jgi:hypothetical protein
MVFLPVTGKIILAAGDSSPSAYVSVMAGLVPAIHVFSNVKL